MKRHGEIVYLFACFFLFLFQANGITFKENKNQWPKKVSYAADLPAGQVFIEKTGFTWKLYNYSDIIRGHELLLNKDSKFNSSSSDIIHGHVFKVEFLNADLSDHKASKILPDYYNYFLGKDPTHWASDVKAYEEVTFSNIYKNIDLQLYSHSGALKYDIIINPGANLNQVLLHYQYTDGIELINNKLIIHISIGEVVESMPEAYQIIKGEKINIACKYILTEKNQIGFVTEQNYDKRYPLVIDPVVVVSSYSGTESVSFGLGVAPDNHGNMYLTSMNITKGYPVTTGAVQTSFAGGVYDCTVSKFNATGTAKRFSTYIGGNNNELIINCVVQNNEVALFGTTQSDTFPIIKDGYQTIYKGRTDYFIIKIDTSGKNLLASTYLGGDKSEGASNLGSATIPYYITYGLGEMVMDNAGDCYIIGTTYSYNYPTTPNSFREYSDSNSGSDIVITRLNNSLSELKWSTYYGGAASNASNGIRLSRTGKVFCSGTTLSKNFYTTPGVVHTTSVSSEDMVVFTLDQSTGFPIASTYVGSLYSECKRMDIDQNENVYLLGGMVFGYTTNVTPGCYDVSTGNMLFYQLNSSLSQINYVGRFGYNTTAETKVEIDAMNIDSCGYIYMGGFGKGGLPVTDDAFKQISSDKGNLYLAVFNPGFTALKFGSYYGGTTPQFEDHDDGGLNYFDDRGYFYHANCVWYDFPITPNAYSGYNVKDSMSANYRIKNSDAFVKIDLQTFVNANASLGGLIKSCSPITTTFAANPNLGSVTIIPGDNSAAVNSNTLVHTYSTYGTYTAFVVAGSDSSTCNISDSIKIIFKYGKAPVKVLNDSSINCMGSTLILDAGNNGSTYTWNTGETTQKIKPTQTGNYWVKIDNEFCSATDSTYAVVEEGHDYSMPNAFTPNGDHENDEFCLKGWDHCNKTFFIRIYDRWGEKVYESEDPNFCWNGYYRGKLLNPGVYIYYINATYEGDNTINRKGNITLIR